VNLGFLDGHASWMSSEALIAASSEGEYAGISEMWPNSTCGFLDEYPGVPTLY